MRSKTHILTLVLSAALSAAVIMGMSTSALAQKETVLHSFENNGKDGWGPQASLILDSAGNLYGTTADGGTSNDGILFELIRKTGGGWSGRILHSFSNNGVDGSNPVAALTLDSSGSLFGTTRGGGTYGDGTVFELSPRAEGGWSSRIVHSFHNDGVYGRFPLGALILDASGNLYGTTQSGGSSDAGIVFELMPRTGGGYKEEVLYSFGIGGDGGLLMMAWSLMGSATCTEPPSPEGLTTMAQFLS